MATLNFIKGSFHGKVGQFVGSSWKGKDYIKLYTSPGNPKTAGQTAVRTIFQRIVHIAHALYEPVLKLYTFPKPHGMTAFNRMVHINKALFDDKQWDISKVQIFAGSLFNPGITSAAVDTQSGTAVVITFNGGEGEATDIPVGVVHDEVSNQTFCAVGEKRESGSVRVPLTLPTGQSDLMKLHAYLVFSQPPAVDTAKSGQVSNTAYTAVPVA